VVGVAAIELDSAYDLSVLQEVKVGKETSGVQIRGIMENTVRIWALDDRTFDHCGIELFEAAARRGHRCTLFKHTREVTGPGYVFMRLAQHPPRLEYDRGVYHDLRNVPGLTFIQDLAQVEAYENKIRQTTSWREFMPRTHLFTSKDQALENIPAGFLISKSSIGSASHNVRLLRTVDEKIKEIEQVFSKSGIPVVGGMQRGYVIWQEFVPHEVTYRVTAVGDQRHAYVRFNYPDRPMAAPSKVIRTKPLLWSDETVSLLKFCNNFFDVAGTKWAAIDVLKTPDGEWKLLETALGWARGDDESGNFFFYDTKRSLLTQHDLLIDEMEAGVFG
jgi:glutathione synthase/RimK-type ligase-like ATP-grasp enzyme